MLVLALYMSSVSLCSSSHINIRHNTNESYRNSVTFFFVFSVFFSSFFFLRVVEQCLKIELYLRTLLWLSVILIGIKAARSHKADGSGQLCGHQARGVPAGGWGRVPGCR